VFDVVEKELRDQAMELAHTISALAVFQGWWRGAELFEAPRRSIRFFKVKPRIPEIDFYDSIAWSLISG